MEQRTSELKKDAWTLANLIKINPLLSPMHSRCPDVHVNRYVREKQLQL